MSVRFGSDGTLYCNTVKYNYLQTRNLVADNGYTLGAWDYGATSVVTTQSVGCNSQKQLMFAGGNGLQMSTQPMPTPVANHKYYGGIFWKTDNNFSAADSRFEWYYIDGDTNVNLTFTQRASYSTNNNWVLLSDIIQAGSSPASGQWIIRNFVVNGTTNSYCAKPIIIDLTECFGAGNEPTKEWCDENILEWNKIVGYNNFQLTESNVSSSLSFGAVTYGSTYNVGTGNQYFFNRIDVPRSYIVDMHSSTGPEAVVNLPATSLVDESYYYCFAEVSQPNGNSGKNYDWYFPVAEPLLGTVSQVENGNFNNGGGLYNWKRESFYNIRSSWSSGSYNSRFDLNNGGLQLYLVITNFYIKDISSIISTFNQLKNTSIVFSDANKEFCDRWIDGDSDCIIHIKNHLNKSIKFNTSYDIICNDIEINPTINKISYKNDGTIICKKLVRAKEY